MTTTSTMTNNPRKILLLSSEIFPGETKFLITEFFTVLSTLISYVNEHVTTTEEFVLFVSEDVLKALINDPIYHFAQVKSINILCREYDYRRTYKYYIEGVRYGKLRFLHEKLLLQTTKNVIQTAPWSSISDDRTNAHHTSSLREQELHVKRSKPSSYSEPKSKRLATTSTYNTSCLNIERVESPYSCSACKLFLRDPHQLACGHRICCTCLEYKENSMTCITCGESSLKKNIWRDRAIYNDMQQLSVCCCECNWTGLLKSYQAHLNEMHLNAESDSANSVVHKQKTEQRTSYNKTSQGLKSNIGSLPHVNDTQINLLQQDTSSSQQEELTYDNDSIIWKIPNLAKKIVDAKTERQISIYSPPFYSSAGYKMCLRLYLNGDSHTRDTHVSLFFVLMRGDHDAMLQWPFSNKTTFCLLDQSTSNDNRRDISRHFWPDKTLKCLQRPDSDMNAGHGIRRFVSLEQLERDRDLYVRNDTMIIKTTLDFMNEPPDYIPSLNMGDIVYDEDHVDTISENFKYID